KPFITGSEMKFARNPRRARPAASATAPTAIPSAAVIAVNAPAFGATNCATVEADDEVAGAAERRVEDQRRGRGVQADDGRDARDRGVRERFRDEDRPHGEAGDDVAADPRAPVGGKRA